MRRPNTLYLYLLSIFSARGKLFAAGLLMLGISSARYLNRLWLLTPLLLSLLLMGGQAQAVPQLAWSDLSKGAAQASMPQMVVDLRGLWEASVRSEVTQSAAQWIDPSEIWLTPAQQFSPSLGKKIPSLQAHQRYVSRMQVFSEGDGADLVLEFEMPRMDAVHVSYRYDAGEWVTHSAGDVLAMSAWWAPDRQPVFNIPLRKGQMDLVVQIEHRGYADAPVKLQNDRAHRSDATRQGWVLGLLLGVQLMLALMAALIGGNLRLGGFLGVSIMCVAFAGVLFTASGLAGMYFGVDTPHFNDDMKFFWRASLSLVFPLASAWMLGLRRRAFRVWLGAAIYALLGLLVCVWAGEAFLRTGLGFLAPMILSVICVIALIVYAWVKGISRKPLILLAIVLYMAALIVHYTAFLGWLDSNGAGLALTLASTLASIVAISGLYQVHRSGRQVWSRARVSANRDVLTGLLSASGFAAHLKRLQGRLQREPFCALFLGVCIDDTVYAQMEYGQEGYELGSVQLAAAVSASLAQVEGLARISPQLLGGTCIMAPRSEEAARMAQVMLARLLAMADNDMPMAKGAQIVLGWLPLCGMKIETIEAHIRECLANAERNKKIHWIGGAQSHEEMQRYIRRERLAYETPSASMKMEQTTQALQNPSNPNAAAKAPRVLHERIREIEQEMLDGIDTRGLMDEYDGGADTAKPLASKP